MEQQPVCPQCGLAGTTFLVSETREPRHEQTWQCRDCGSRVTRGSVDGSGLRLRLGSGAPPYVFDEAAFHERIKEALRRVVAPHERPTADTRDAALAGRAETIARAGAIRAQIARALAAEIGDGPTAERLADVVIRALERGA